MDRTMKILALLLAVLVAVGAFAYESKYQDQTGGLAATNLYGPVNGQYVVKSLYAKSDKSTSVVKFYARGGGGMFPITTASAISSNVIYVPNGSYGLTTNDTVVYVHRNGTLMYTTISVANTGDVTLASAIAVAGTTDDRIYEVTAQMQYPVGASSALNPSAGWIFATPADSPCYIVLDSTNLATLGTTTDR